MHGEADKDYVKNIHTENAYAKTFTLGEADPLYVGK